MVTQQGFNALLKIVEEPPEHVMFIFATTEPDKVIGTIRSRTHHYPFRLVPQEVMGPYLETICDKEGIKPEPGVLKLAMRAGGGSMRDTLSVLDQLMVGSVEGVITHDAAVALLGFTPEDVRIRDSYQYAEESGVEYHFTENFEETDLHPNTADIILTDENGKVLKVRGKSVGGGKVVIENINGIQVDFTGNYPTILVEQRDAPGVLNFITRVLSARKINIAFMRLYRESKGNKAYTIIEADEKIPEAVIADIESHSEIKSATLLEVE